MNVQICSHGALLELLAADPSRWDLLLITTPNDAMRSTLPQSCSAAVPFARCTLHLSFHDYDRPQLDAVLPSAEDVRRALEWSADSTDLVVSCSVGRSRSAALAYVICCKNHPPQEAIEILDTKWHSPNRLIVLHGAKLLQSSAVFQVFSAWLGEV